MPVTVYASGRCCSCHKQEEARSPEVEQWVHQAGQAAATRAAVVILDEVDAALDQTNQALVAALLKVSPRPHVPLLPPGRPARPVLEHSRS